MWKQLDTFDAAESNRRLDTDRSRTWLLFVGLFPRLLLYYRRLGTTPVDSSGPSRTFAASAALQLASDDKWNWLGEQGPATPEEVRISAALDGLRSLSSDRNRPFCWRRPAGGSPVAPGVAAPACRRQNGTDADTRRRRSILDEIWRPAPPPPPYSSPLPALDRTAYSFTFLTANSCNECRYGLSGSRSVKRFRNTDSFVDYFLFNQFSRQSLLIDRIHGPSASNFRTWAGSLTLMVDPFQIITSSRENSKVGINL